MTTKISVAAQNAAADGVAALLNSGTVKIYTGAAPTNVSDAPTGTLLGTLTLSATAFGSSSSGTATANTITGDSSADATGTAGYFRGLDSGGTAVIQGSVTATGGGGDMTLDSTSIVAGGTISMTSWTLTMPAS